MVLNFQYDALVARESFWKGVSSSASTKEQEAKIGSRERESKIVPEGCAEN